MSTFIIHKWFFSFTIFHKHTWVSLLSRFYWNVFTPCFKHSLGFARAIHCQTLWRQLKPGRISPRTRRKQSKQTSAHSIHDRFSPKRDIFPNEVQEHFLFLLCYFYAMWHVAASHKKWMKMFPPPTPLNLCATVFLSHLFSPFSANDAVRMMFIESLTPAKTETT